MKRNIASTLYGMTSGAFVVLSIMQFTNGDIFQGIIATCVVVTSFISALFACED